MHACSVNVKNLSHTTDIPSLAKKVVDTCELINPARLPEVEQLLLYLQARKEGDAGQLAMSRVFTMTSTCPFLHMYTPFFNREGYTGSFNKETSETNGAT